MEDASVTQATLDMCKKAKDYYPKCGTVLQAYMRRTIDDINSIVEHDTNLRLCKGAYKESEDIAYLGYQEVRNNYMKSVKLMMENDIYIGFATHDEWLIKEIESLIEKKKYPKNTYEFQDLSGVPIDKNLER